MASGTQKAVDEQRLLVDAEMPSRDILSSTAFATGQD